MEDHRQPLEAFDDLVEAFAQPEAFNLRVFLDAAEGVLVEVAADLVDYCRGDQEGADLQLSDSHELPLAQAIAEEEIAAEAGFDADGLPFDPDERRFFEVPQLSGGRPPGAAERAARSWLAEHGLGAG